MDTTPTQEATGGADHSVEKDAPESDPADYGYADLPRGHYGVRIIPNTPPELVTCRTCGHVATDHTRGQFSIYGTCPIPPEGSRP